MHGQETREALLPQKEASEAGLPAGMSHANDVCGFVLCTDGHKRWCVFYLKNLGTNQKQVFRQFRGNSIYPCGIQQAGKALVAAN